MGRKKAGNSPPLLSLLDTSPTVPSIAAPTFCEHLVACLSREGFPESRRPGGINRAGEMSTC